MRERFGARGFVVGVLRIDRRNERKRLLPGLEVHGARGLARRRRLVLGLDARLLGLRRLHSANAGEAPRRFLQVLRVLLDHLASHLLLAAALPVVGPGGAHGSEPRGGPVAGGGEDHREGELRRQDQRHEDARGHHDVRAGPVEVGQEQRGQDLAGGAPRSDRLALEGHAAEGQGEEGREGKEQEDEPRCLRVRRLDGLAPEQLPSHHAQHHGDEHRRHAEELRDQQLRQEGAEGPDEVARGPRRPGLEEWRRVEGIVGGEADEEHEGHGERREPEELRQPSRSCVAVGHL